MNQSAVTPACGKFIENQRWHHQGVTFATVHIVGSKHHLEVRTLSAASEFFEPDEANIEWLQSAFAGASQKGSRAVMIAFQADVFDLRTPFEDFPGWSGFKRSIEGALLPLADGWGKPVLVIHGDSHQFRIGPSFSLQRRPLRNITRLIVPGAADVRVVRVPVRPLALSHPS
ncbi:MAG: hypothetical protein WCI59_08215 [Betaproteobacteria bacterium]